MFNFSIACLIAVTAYATYCNTDLLRLLSQDDRDAFTELYNRYWKKLFAIVFSRLKEKETAKDIVHDIFASMWKNRHHAISIESLENYLAVSAKYMVLSVIRKKLREETIISNTVFTTFTEPSVESSLHFKKILELVKTETENLPEKCRLIFKYSRNEGMPVKKIASALDISPKTVENQLTKAIRHLKLAAQSLLQSLVVFVFIQ